MGGTRFVILLLDWEKPDKSKIPKILSCTFVGTYGNTSQFYRHFKLAFVRGSHRVKLPNTFMVELRTSDFSSARVLANSPQIA